MEFLVESNAIEGILDIRYDCESFRAPERGHAGALLRACRLAEAAEPLSLAEMCVWQLMVTEEQSAHGHPVPGVAKGRLRGPDLPVDVMVGDRAAAGFAEVPRRLAEWLSALNHALGSLLISDVELADCLGTYLHELLAIHPFIDGNGRTARLVAAYIALMNGQPLIVIRAAERGAYQEAQRSRATMRIFMAEKIRERVRLLDGQIAERAGSHVTSDWYHGKAGSRLVVERHDLVEAVEHWSALARR